MLIHILREKETISDLSKLYSINKESIYNANKIDLDTSLRCGDKILIPCNNFYYFKQREESVDSVVSKFNISKEELYNMNKTPLCFKDGSIRLEIKIKKKDIKVYSFVDMTLGSNAFIEADLESEYVDFVFGYNAVMDENDNLFIEDYYLKKIHDIDKVGIGLVLNGIKCDTYKALADYALEVVKSEYYKDITLYYDLTNIDIELLFKELKDRDIEVNLLLDKYLFDKVIKDDELVRFINKNVAKVFILPNFISDKAYTTSEKYFDFLKEASLFDKNKAVIGLNLNDWRNEDILDIARKVEYIYALDFKYLVLYSCGNRFFQMDYILNHFFHK